MWFFKKTVKKATKKFQSLAKDMEDIIRAQTKEQNRLENEVKRLNQDIVSCGLEAAEAETILDNVRSFIGKKHSS